MESLFVSSIFVPSNIIYPVCLGTGLLSPVNVASLSNAIPVIIQSAGTVMVYKTTISPGTSSLASILIY